jgi:hypothetical protein
MVLTIVTVHPSRTIVRAGDDQFEVPTAAFPTRPAEGQTWDLQLNRQLHEREKLDQLNQYLKHD